MLTAISPLHYPRLQCDLFLCNEQQDVSSEELLTEGQTDTVLGHYSFIYIKSSTIYEVLCDKGRGKWTEDRQINIDR